MGRMESGSAVWIALMFVATVMLTGMILSTVEDHRITSLVMSAIVDYWTFDDSNDTSRSIPSIGSDVIFWSPDVYYDCTYSVYGCAVDQDGTSGSSDVIVDTNGVTVSFYYNKYGGRDSGNILRYGGMRFYVSRTEVFSVYAADGTRVRGRVPVGQYVSITVTCENNGTIALYINGELEEEKNVTTCVDENGLIIYDRQSLLDELKLFDRALSEREVKALYTIESTAQLARIRFIPRNILDDMEALARLVFYLMLLILIGMSWAYFTETGFEMDTKYMIFAFLAVAFTYALMLSVASGVNFFSFLHIVELGEEAWKIVLITEALAVAFLATAFLKTL